MAKPHILSLSETDRRDALAVAAGITGRPAALLEKDIWVVWALQALFAQPFGAHLVFKGGTSLSKAFAVIARFSEDVDLTYDIRQLTGHAEAASPSTTSAAKRLTKTVRDALPGWLEQVVVPALKGAIGYEGLEATVRLEGSDVYLEYGRNHGPLEYVHPRVKLEFGARSTGEPCLSMAVVCDASAHLPGLEFPSALPRVMRAERTFWEKATAVHVFCLNGRLGPERYSRHWYDLVRLDEAGIAASAIQDTALADSVAQHKAMFFVEKDDAGRPIDYSAAVSGGLVLVPTGDRLVQLAEDYRRMVGAGLLDLEMSFGELMGRCEALEGTVNRGVLA